MREFTTSLAAKELQVAAELFDIYTVANLLTARPGAHDVVSFEDVLRVYPELRENVTPGYDGRGQMTFKVLARDRVTKRMIIFAAMHDCAAPPHLHVGGEHTLTLQGRLFEHSWSWRLCSKPEFGGYLEPRFWGAMTFHQPFVDERGTWLGVYDQPAGLVLFDALTKEQLKNALHLRSTCNPDLNYLWDELSLEESRLAVTHELGLRVASGTPKVGAL